MAKSNLYTRTGDMGATSLVGGIRVKKNSLRLEAYGTLDEFSSFLGCVLSHPDCPPEDKERLLSVQDTLFNIGSYLATEVKPGEEPEPWGVSEYDILDLEEWTDALDAATPRIKAFVLPGGCMAAAHAHVARTVCRRAERRILDLADTEFVHPIVLRYINRLSDFLFILARNLNAKAGVEEIIWRKPSRNAK